jgi:hypothetical protein
MICRTRARLCGSAGRLRWPSCSWSAPASCPSCWCWLPCHLAFPVAPDRRSLWVAVSGDRAGNRAEPAGERKATAAHAHAARTRAAISLASDRRPADALNGMAWTAEPGCTVTEAIVVLDARQSQVIAYHPRTADPAQAVPHVPECCHSSVTRSRARCECISQPVAQRCLVREVSSSAPPRCFVRATS